MVAACPFPYARGTPIRILRMAEALAQIGHEIHVVTYHLGAGAASAALHIHRTAELASYRHFGPGPTFGKLCVLDPLLVVEAAGVLRRFPIDVPPITMRPPGRGRSRRRLRAWPARRAHPGGV